MKSEFIITSSEFAKLIIEPAFQDLTPNAPYEGVLFDFTLMDLQGKSSAQIMNIRRTGNILQRRDASCDLNYKKMMRTSLRKITADELYAAVKHCGHEFYTGALKDFRANDPVFGKNILPFFRAAVRQDIVTNSFFGSLDRTPNPNSEFSTTLFDGALVWIKKYLANGVMPSNQAFSLDANTDYRVSPSAAYAAFENCINKQNVLMRNMALTDKAFYCSQNMLDGLHAYHQALGQSTPELVGMTAQGVKIYSHKGIAIFVEPTWEPILAELSGNTKAAWILLTVRGNFTYAYDSKYGEGENMNQALMIWYEKKELSWYYQMFLKAGEQIALPEHIVMGITPW